MSIINIKNYQPSTEDLFMFDSNIWVYLFDKTITPERYISNSIDEYTEFYKKILNSKSRIYISALNIHEIAKKFIRNDKQSYEAFYGSIKYKEEYRESDSYKNLLDHIKNVNDQILKCSICVNDNFENFEHSKFFNKGIDFIDEYFGFISKTLNCKLITHDQDFINCPFDIDIISANRKLLRN